MESVVVDKSARLVKRAVAFPAEFRVVAGSHSLVEGELEGEVECCGVHIRAANPVGNGVEVCVPVFANGVASACRAVVFVVVAGRVAFHHVVTPADVAEVVLQEVEISLDAGAYLCVRVVEVAEPVKVVAGVGSACRLFLTFYPIYFVGAADSPRTPRVGYTLVGLGREVGPIGNAGAVVDYDVFDDACAFALERINHVAQFGFATE